MLLAARGTETLNGFITMSTARVWSVLGRRFGSITNTPVILQRNCVLPRHLGNPTKLEAYMGGHSLHTACARPAGHNKWSKIKRKKEVTDQEKSRMRGRLLDQIRAAVVSGGGSDPATNVKLVGLLTQARSSGIPKSNIESALAAGSGLRGAAREAVMYEGRGPSGYLILIEALTDNRNRTRPEIRHIIEKQGGVLGEPGSSSFTFHQKGIIEITTDLSSSHSTIDATELAIEVGAEDVEVFSEQETGGGDMIQLECEPGDLNAVCGAVGDKGLEILSASVVYLPRSTVSLTGEQYEKAEKMIELLGDQSDVVAVYSNHELA